MRDTKEKLSLLSIGLHGLIASVFIGLIVVGMDYPILHKSLGLIIIIPVILRIFWRIINGWPKPLNTPINIERILAKISHWILIVGSFLLPVTGVIMSAYGGYGIDVFGFVLLPENYDPNNNDIIPINQTISDTAYILHEVVSNIMIVIILLHIIGALKHHFIYKDHTLYRMFKIKK
jgi:cytochrome b561